MDLQTLKGKGRRGNESSSDEEIPAKKRRADLTDGMQELGDALKESERVRFKFKKEKLDRECDIAGSASDPWCRAVKPAGDQ